MDAGVMPTTSLLTGAILTLGVPGASSYGVSALLRWPRLIHKSRRSTVSWPPEEEAFEGVWIGVRERSAHLSWHRLHREARGRSLRYFYEGPWPAGIRTWNLPRPYKRRSADGSSVDYRSYSQVFLELPLWGLCLIFGAYPTVVFFRGPIRRRLQLWRDRRKKQKESA